MAQTQYLQNRPSTLQDLLNQSASQPQAPVNVPAPPDAYQVNTEGIMTPQDRQKLLDVLLAPDEAGPAPQVDKPSALAMLFSGLGDAVNAFNVGKTGNPSLRSDFFDQYQRNLAQQKADLQAYQEKAAQGRNRSKQRTAEYLLSADERSRLKQDAIAGRQEIQKAAIADREQARKDQAALAATKLAQDAAQAESDQKARIELENLRNSHERGRIQLENRLKGGDKEAGNDLKSFSMGARIANGFGSGVAANPGKGIAAIPPLAERIASGESPDDIRREFENELTAEGVFGHGRDLARDFFNEKMVSIGRSIAAQKAQANADTSSVAIPSLIPGH